ncbi:TerD family protein [Streptomyces chartreusis]|uniref:TerD family protein n=1 Tax=Streptomyces chartreusis TaxID=1969 RepID=UPI0033CF8DC0
MGVCLSKGGNVSLSKEAPGLTAVLVGLGWDVRTTTGTAYALDASTETAMVFGELYRNGAWGRKYRAVGQGYASGLAGIAADFGVKV